jgi:putative ABC transport system ATP-binding protein
VAVVGQSGSGKSTMMNVLGCLDIPTRGDYFLDGTDVRELTDKELSRIRNKQIGFIFQQYNLIQTLTVVENVELPLIYQGVGADDRREMALEALERVGLAGRVKHKPMEMSGGQQQRVAIARAIATKPPIIMADEPTGALDSHTGLEVLEFLRQLNKEGSTVILITHDNGIAATARRIVRLQNSRRWTGFEFVTGGQNGHPLHPGEKGPVHADHAGHHHRYRRRYDHRLGYERLQGKNHGPVRGDGQQ